MEKLKYFIRDFNSEIKRQINIILKCGFNQMNMMQHNYFNWILNARLFYISFFKIILPMFLECYSWNIPLSFTSIIKYILWNIVSINLIAFMYDWCSLILLVNDCGVSLYNICYICKDVFDLHFFARFCYWIFASGCVFSFEYSLTIDYLLFIFVCTARFFKLLKGV